MDGDNSDFNYEDKESILSVVGGIGMAVPLGSKVTFDVMGGYNHLRIKDKKDNPDNYRRVYGTFGLKFGFIVFLGKSE